MQQVIEFEQFIHAEIEQAKVRDIMTGIHVLYIHNNFGRHGWLNEYNFIVTGFNEVFFFFGIKTDNI